MLYAPYGAVTEQKFATMARKFVPENLLTIDFWEIFWVISGNFCSEHKERKLHKSRSYII